MKVVRTKQLLSEVGHPTEKGCRIAHDLHTNLNIGFYAAIIIFISAFVHMWAVTEAA